MYSGSGNQLLSWLGFPIRTFPDQCSVGNSPELFAATHVLHRLSAPRHPSHALSSLLSFISLTANCVSRRSSPREEETHTPALRHGYDKTRELIFRNSSEIEFYPSYAFFKEQAFDPMVKSKKNKVELDGIEPTTPSLQSLCSPS